MILYTEGGTKQMQADAESVLMILCTAYPGHPWGVRVDQGVVFIRHLEFPGNWGMCKKFADVIHDAAVFKKEIIMSAGEFLERAGLVRGRANGDEIVQVEGVPEKYQPNQPAVEFTNTVVAEDMPLRTTPHPRALKEPSVH